MGGASIGPMTSESNAKPKLVRDADVWLVRIEQPNGKVQEYRCSSESQAKQLAQVLTSPSAL